jgi:hypothetical protein
VARQGKARTGSSGKSEGRDEYEILEDQDLYEILEGQDEYVDE